MAFWKYAEKQSPYNLKPTPALPKGGGLITIGKMGLHRAYPACPAYKTNETNKPDKQNGQ